jgi:hypothetical protein
MKTPSRHHNRRARWAAGGALLALVGMGHALLPGHNIGLPEFVLTFVRP